MQLLEMMANGDEPVTEEEHMIHAITLESGFSKKELQNPETIKKILNQKHAFVSIGKWMTCLIGILVTLISIPTVVGIFIFPVLFGSLLATLNDYPRVKNNKQIKKLKEQCEKLKSKMEKNIANDPKNISKYKEIIKNCDKTIDAVDEYFKKIEDKKFMAEVDKALEVYKRLVSWLDSPFSDDDLEIFSLAQELGIKESAIISRIVKKSDNMMQDMEPFYGNLDEHYKPDEKEHLLKLIPELRKSNECITLYSSGHTDSACIYSKMTKSIVVGNFQDLKSFKKTTIYNAANQYSNIYNKHTKEAIIEADKILGYYKLSKCPDAVIPKEFKL